MSHHKSGYVSINRDNQKPTAYITKNKSRLKIRNGNVYLDNGSTYELEFYNPLKTRVQALIYLDGRLIHEGGLVLRPGERCFLERHIDEKREFVFKTYEVENTHGSRRAIENNGDVKVEFFEETTPTTQWEITWEQSEPVPFLYPYPNPLPPYPYPRPWRRRDEPYLIHNTSHQMLASNAAMGSGVNLSSQASALRSAHMKASAIETGRTEKGAVSNQNLETTDGTFSSYVCATYEYKILPTSVQQFEASDVSKVYCSGCGKRLKQSENYCSKCGRKKNS